MNTTVAFFITPKVLIKYLDETLTVRQAIEMMDFHHYSAVPLLKSNGEYLGVVSVGDILWYLKDHNFDNEEAMKKNIKEVKQTREYKSICIDTQIEELARTIINQTFVPVTDDRNMFIGIVTRKTVMNQLLQESSKK